VCVHLCCCFLSSRSLLKKSRYLYRRKK
jgi:hypothetical protein